MIKLKIITHILRLSATSRDKSYKLFVDGGRMRRVQKEFTDLGYVYVMVGVGD